MEIQATLTLAEMQTIVDTKCPNMGWKVVINTNKMRLGVCKYRSKIIGISIFHALTSPRAELMNTLLHEIAHVLVGPGNGHNNIWRQTALILGCDGTRCGKNMEVRGKYVGKCDKCNKEINLHRQPKRTLYHKVCGIKSRIVF